jgi:hypothetical protein
MSDEQETPRPLDSPAPVEPPTAPDTSSYFEKLLLLIPSDMVAGYLALDGILKQSTPDIKLWIYWAVFASLLFLTPLYIHFKPTENSALTCSARFRVITGTISFAVWVFALGGPFAATFDWYRPLYGSLLLVITTLAIPVLEKIAKQLKF